MSNIKTDSQIPQRFSGEWETKQLGEIASFFKGSGLSKMDLSSDGKRRCIHYGELFTTYAECITKVLHGTNRDGTFFLSLANDVLMPGSDVTPNGLATASCISMPDVILGGDILVLRVPADVLNGTFLAYAIKINHNQVMRLVSGTTVYHLYGRDIANFSFVAPSVEEQSAIVQVLSDVDGLLNALEALIAKKRAIKQATMQQLLTGKTRLPGFTGTWETKRVSEFGDIVTGATPSTKVNAFWDGPYPWITPTDITSERDMTVSERMITQEGLNAIRTLPPNTVLVTCIASIGKNAILKTTGSCNQQINAVTPNSAHNADFLYYIFEINSNFLLANAGITATNIVSKSVFSKLIFEVPLLDEQNAIASVLSDMDAEIAALEQRRDKTLAIKHGMMQQLLTGRVRLINPKSDMETDI